MSEDANAECTWLQPAWHWGGERMAGHRGRELGRRVVRKASIGVFTHESGSPIVPGTSAVNSERANPTIHNVDHPRVVWPCWSGSEAQILLLCGKPRSPEDQEMTECTPLSGGRAIHTEAVGKSSVKR